jgi:RHS repeat-associated protein
VTLIGGKPAAVVGDMVMEPHAIIPLPPSNTIMMGEMTVLVGAFGGGGGGDGFGMDDCSGDECTEEGHPVNVATGEVTAHGVDLDLPGLIPVLWVRKYSSKRATVSSDFGFGWTHALSYALTVLEDGVIFTDAEGRHLRLPLPTPAERSRYVSQGVSCRVEGDEWIIETPMGRELIFRPAIRDLAFPPVLLRDGFGNAVEFVYSAGQLIGLRDSSGRYVLLGRDEHGRMRSLSIADGDPDQAITLRIYTYDSAGDLRSVTDSTGAETRYEYSDHLLTTEIDRAGNAWHFRYDGSRRCIETWGPEGLLYRRFHFAPSQDRRAFTVDSLGYTWVYESDEMGRVTAMETPLGHREETLWHQGLILARTDRNGYSEAYKYASVTGNPVEFTDRSGHAWKIEYDHAGRECRRTDPEGAASENVYDERGALIEVRDPLGNATRYETDQRGLRTSAVLPTGKRLLFTYDRHGFLAEARVESAEVGDRFRYDFRGLLRERIYADGNRLEFAYDSEGRITRVSNAEATLASAERDASGRIVTTRDGEGRVFRYKRNALGYITEVDAPSADLASPRAIIRYVYNTENRIECIHLPNGERYEYKYDADRRVTLARYPDGRSVRMKHDGFKNTLLLAYSDGSRIEQSFTPTGKLAMKRVVSADGRVYTSTYAYDGLDRVVLAANDDHVVETKYAPNGKPLLEVQDGHRFRYEYDPLGRRSAMVYPDGVRVTYTHDDQRGELEIHSDVHGTFRVAFDSVERPKHFVHPNGVVESFDYDARSQITAQYAVKGSAEVFSRKYRRTAGGEIGEIIDGRRSSRISYGGESRAVEVLSPAGEGELSGSYRFDAMNNLVAGPGDARFDYGPGNILVSAAGRAYRYNGRGDVAGVSSGSREIQYEYDAEGMLRAVRKPDRATIRFTYDALARRVTKTVEGKITRFLWDVSVVAAEESSNGAVHYLFYPENFLPIARSEDSGSGSGAAVFSYHIDAAGAVRGMTDASGQVVWTAAYSPLGLAQVDEHSRIENPIRVVGEYWDAELELGYHRRRYYDPVTGRFMTPDPSDVAGGLNLYVFHRNAFSFFDPFGANPFAFLWGQAYEDFLSATSLSGGAGMTPTNTPLGLRNYDNFMNDTFYEAKWIGENGPSQSALDRMTEQLAKDESLLAEDSEASIKWIFNRDPNSTKGMEDIAKKLEELKSKYPGRFTYEVKKPPKCFKSTYYDPLATKLAEKLASR